MNSTHRRGTSITLTACMTMLSLLVTSLQISSAPAQAASPAPQVLVAAGNIARPFPGCNDSIATARVLDTIFPNAAAPGIVQTLGDNARDGSANVFDNCYGGSGVRWGRQKSRTMPAIGDEEYRSMPPWQPYVDYFREKAGEPGKFYYGYDLGDWHVIVLNSMCVTLASDGDPNCNEEMMAWLDDELDRTATQRCTVAVYHHPRFNSAAEGNSAVTRRRRSLQGLWAKLYTGGVDIVLNAHESNYQRFTPMDQFGEAHAGGMRQFIVGTGGFARSPFGQPPTATIERRNDTALGVLKLTLKNESYDWQFMPAAGSTFTDANGPQDWNRCRFDASAPSTSADLLGEPGNNGWHVAPVKVTLEPTDAPGGYVSGIDSTFFRVDDDTDWIPYSGPFTLPDGKHTLRFFSRDKAGNEEAVQTVPVWQDTTVPSIQLSAKDELWPPNGKLVNAGLKAEVDDALSGVGRREISVTSSEPDPTGDDIVLDPQTPALWLRAERDAPEFGRTYSVKVTAFDSAGNRKVANTTIEVPHDRGLGGGHAPPESPPPPEPPAPPVPRIVAAPGPDPQSAANVRLIDLAGQTRRELKDTLGDAQRFGATVAACDLDGNGIDEIAVAPSMDSTTPAVRLLNPDGSVFAEPIDPGYSPELEVTGLNIACGDLDGGPVDEIVIGPSGPHASTTDIKLYEGDGTMHRVIETYGDGVQGGVRVSTGDVDGDGLDEVVTAPGPAPDNPAQVKVFGSDGELLSDFIAFDELRGAHVAAGDRNGDGRAEIFVSPGPDPLSPATVRVFRFDGALLDRFSAPDPAPHLEDYGYWHIHDPIFGLDLPAVASYTTWGHFGDPQFVSDARSLGQGALLQIGLPELEPGKDLAWHQERWREKIAAVRAELEEGDEQSIKAVLVKDQPDVKGWSTEMQREAVKLVEESFPGLKTVMTYSQHSDPLLAPPANLDWIASDLFFPKNFDNTGCAERDEFEAVVEHLEWAADWAADEPAGVNQKRVVMIGPSYQDPTHPMPSECQQRWFFEAALSEPEVVGFLWFMYGFAEGSQIKGVSAYPDLVAEHRRLFDSVRYGGWGAQLAAGDLDGDGKDELVIGHGAGPGNTTGARAYSGYGSPFHDPFVAFPGARYGVALAVGGF